MMLVSVVSAIAGSARLSRENRPTSSAAKCWAPRPLPPLPNTSSCPPAADVLFNVSAAATTPSTDRRADSSCSAAESRRISSTSWPRSSAISVARPDAAASRGPVLRQVRAELILGDLQRLGRASLQSDLHRKILAQRMTFPVFGHQQPSKIAVAVEFDAEHVPDFALEPAGAGPHGLHRRHMRGRS